MPSKARSKPTQLLPAGSIAEKQQSSPNKENLNQGFGRAFSKTGSYRSYTSGRTLAMINCVDVSNCITESCMHVEGGGRILPVIDWLAQ